MKRVLKIALYVALGWTVLTIITQFLGKAESKVVAFSHAELTALIYYNPDPYYNFDQQVCNAFASGLAKHGFESTIVPCNEAANNINTGDLLVFCANTYNFAPDWKIKKLINSMNLEDQPVVAITLGAGTTSRAQKILEDLLVESGAHLISSKSYWLLRPNDESRLEENNVAVALDLSKSWADSLAGKMANW